MKPIYLNPDRTSWMVVEKQCLIVFSEVACGCHKTMSRALIPWRVLWKARDEMKKHGNRDIRPSAQQPKPEVQP